MNEPGEDSWSERLRGLLLGLALGDSYERARGSFPRRGVIEVGVATQLATFTADGLIRALATSGDHLAPGQVAPALWNALTRWGAQQEVISATDASGAPVPNGWLSEVPALSERRGSAPATVSAVRGERPGTLEQPGTSSGGTQVVTRLLPTAAVRHLLPYEGIYSEADAEVASYAVLTHGEGSAIHSAVATASLASSCLAGMDVREAVGASPFDEMGSLFSAARDIAGGRPRDPSALRQWLRDDATSAMTGGIYTAISFPEHDDVQDALDFAYRLPGGRGSATVAAALIGAVHGVHALPVEAVSRLELNWVLDQLAVDLAQHVRGLGVISERYPIPN